MQENGYKIAVMQFKTLLIYQLNNVGWKYPTYRYFLKNALELVEDELICSVQNNK